jgi:hypothetical protein
VCLIPSHSSKRLAIYSLSGLRESVRGGFYTHNKCASHKYNSHGGAFPLWTRHVTAAPIGVIVVDGLPQKMGYQRASMPTPTKNMLILVIAVIVNVLKDYIQKMTELRNRA